MSDQDSEECLVVFAQKLPVGGELAEPEGQPKLSKAQKKNMKRLEKKAAQRAAADTSVASSEVALPKHLFLCGMDSLSTMKSSPLCLAVDMSREYIHSFSRSIAGLSILLRFWNDC